MTAWSSRVSSLLELFDDFGLEISHFLGADSALDVENWKLADLGT